MSIKFRLGRQVTPSGFGLAMINVPPLDPEKNISLIDKSYTWEENVANSEAAVVKSYVDSGGHMPKLTITDFVITNVTTPDTNDIDKAPLYYRHVGRFHHYSYGDNPTKRVYITDQNENILKGINYIVRASKITSNVYIIDILTDFQNSEYVSYKVKYNRCLSDGSSVYPGWTENLNATPLFTSGTPTVNIYQYSLLGPDTSGLYTCVVPAVPTLTELTNSVGISFENSPTMITEYAKNTGVYLHSVKYTLKATGPTTFTIQRNKKRDTGVASTDYLTSVTTETWGVATNFTAGTAITGLPGIYLMVNNDNYLKTNDQAYFSASRSYYYLKPTSYSSIYAAKPKHATAQDDWYLQIRDGRFRRRMNTSGEAVPSGQGVHWEYAIPEYDYQLFDFTHGPPYKEVINERAEILDSQTIQLQRTPVFIMPSDVLYDEFYPGFPPSSYMQVTINDTLINQNSIIDWDVYNGTVKLAQLLAHRDNITVDYIYEEKFYEYTGFAASGNGYPTVEPLTFLSLDLNPTPWHNYGMYSSGNIAHIFIKPYINLDTNFCINSSVLYHNYTGVPSGVYDFNVAQVSLGPSCRIDDIEITDVRTRGGGLNSRGIRELEKVKDVQPEAEMFWDVGYFDGKAIPAQGALVVEIPKTVLKSNGGKFEEDEVRVKVLRHIAVGSYPIINYV